MAVDRRSVGGVRGAAMLLLPASRVAIRATAARQAAAPPEVTVAHPLVKKLTEWDEFTGRFEPVQRVAIKARVPG